MFNSSAGGLSSIPMPIKFKRIVVDDAAAVLPIRTNQGKEAGRAIASEDAKNLGKINCFEHQI